MKLHAFLLTGAVLLVGCEKSVPSKPPVGGPTVGSAEKTTSDLGESTASTASEAASVKGDGPTPVKVSGGLAILGPENSKVMFVGAHVGEKPDPRTGGFEEFSGTAAVDEGKLVAIGFDIKTDSTWTEIGGKLTTHLKSPDFLDSKEFPEIKFQSTKVETADGGKATITGDLTMHGETKPITIPATVTITDAGITLVADFTIDRSEFGMFSPQTEKVEKKVELKVVVGEKTDAKPGPA
jgi:polyisoprenoid-binding protein YceI